ncbi:hypothetical protein AHiyo4_16560 [Arthrobacter sp. Hiyo4]|nr:hypothetical protein AHiyo4_16560 [Arthrobacter sp. Hiyo4]
MYVLTIDQRGSTADVDRVPDLIAALRALTPAPFERSVGDELQGVVEHAEDVVEIALYALRSGHWYVGIGIGPYSSPRAEVPGRFRERLCGSAKSRGTRQRLGWSRAIVGGVRQYWPWTGDASPRQGRAMASANAQAVLRLIGRVVQQRTPAQWRVVDRLRALQGGEGKHGSQKHVAQELGITEQSVSRAVLRSGWLEEWAARPAAAMLLDHAHSQIEGDR